MLSTLAMMHRRKRLFRDHLGQRIQMHIAPSLNVEIQKELKMEIKASGGAVCSRPHEASWILVDGPDHPLIQRYAKHPNKIVLNFLFIVEARENPAVIRTDNYGGYRFGHSNVTEPEDDLDEDEDEDEDEQDEEEDREVNSDIDELEVKRGIKTTPARNVRANRAQGNPGGPYTSTEKLLLAQWHAQGQPSNLENMRAFAVEHKSLRKPESLIKYLKSPQFKNFLHSQK